ncbi:MAG TPA: response regulator [Polyangiaceae bacterium]|jgi:DNA-binding response OmpR family regulator|nr:response regulator [Polyangiaceae bacterium]
MSELETKGASEAKSRPAQPARLLLAEDDFELRELLAYVLRADGHEVVEARDGHDLLRILSESTQRGAASEPFALVVSDVRMPGLTAFDVLTRVQRTLSDTPVILITAFGDQTTHLRAQRLGACRVFDKPFDFDDLRAAVDETLRQRRLRAS